MRLCNKYEKVPVLKVPCSKVKILLETFARTCVCVSVRIRNSACQGLLKEQPLRSYILGYINSKYLSTSEGMTKDNKCTLCNKIVAFNNAFNFYISKEF